MATSEDGAAGPPDGLVEAVARAIIRSDYRGDDYREPLYWKAHLSYALAAIAAVRAWDAERRVSVHPGPRCTCTDACMGACACGCLA